MKFPSFSYTLLTAALLATICGFTAPVSRDRKAKKAVAAKGAINWLSFDQAVAKAGKEPRKIMIDVYTDWCGWCKRMDQTTFSDADVASYANKNFYAIKFNAESKEPITLNGKTYKYNPQYKSHELAVELLQGRMSYPTTVYLDENFNTLSPVAGYLSAEVLEKILHYYGENQHTKMPWPEYEKSYVKANHP